MMSIDTSYEEFTYEEFTYEEFTYEEFTYEEWQQPENQLAFSADDGSAVWVICGEETHISAWQPPPKNTPTEMLSVHFYGK